MTSETMMRVLKEATCPSSSGKSTLTYQIGCNEKEELYIRVFKNTGNGYFSQSWQTMKSIMALLEESQAPITGATLLPLYNRLSINTSYFLLVCLMNEGLVERWKRIYKLTDSEAFRSKMKALIASKGDVKTAPPKKKSPSKKKKSEKPVQETPTNQVSTPL